MPIANCSCGFCIKSGYSVILDVRTYRLTAECDIYKCQYEELNNNNPLEDVYIRFFSTLYLDPEFKNEIEKN